MLTFRSVSSVLRYHHLGRCPLRPPTSLGAQKIAPLECYTSLCAERPREAFKSKTQPRATFLRRKSAKVNLKVTKNMATCWRTTTKRERHNCQLPHVLFEFWVFS